MTEFITIGRFPKESSQQYVYWISRKAETNNEKSEKEKAISESVRSWKGPWDYNLKLKLQWR